ncbi:hypothetical protein PZB75_16270 [Streptomyces sp. AM 4-1-1]|uniref:hypothetical protein n=1 Tax=Streptomyces sp. AM 4-1-1 TaxID=3028710 RepID=UPI0023BA23E2|nr:hypothetical protein [Streptomyces sp. AM 4-1-1]WEH34769.1 hypothetical protein PZB75_16270 [Streptomyces sp. AM 4-1-1]
MTDSNAWENAKKSHPVGSRIRGTVRARFDFGAFLELEGTPDIKGFIDVISYRPDGTGRDVAASLPGVGDTVEGTVASLVDRDQQIRIRVGSPFWQGER